MYNATFKKNTLPTKFNTTSHTPRNVEFRCRRSSNLLVEEHPEIKESVKGDHLCGLVVRVPG
jgi:hypothetical protein